MDLAKALYSNPHNPMIVSFTFCSGQYECCASSDKLQSCICIKSLFSCGAATCDEWVTLMNNDINYGLPEYKTVASCPLQ
jgi:hypothetical protein